MEIVEEDLTFKYLGYYSSAGASNCTICSAGDDCSNPAATTPCAAGTYSNQGDSGCTNCPAGKLIHITPI